MDFKLIKVNIRFSITQILGTLCMLLLSACILSIRTCQSEKGSRESVEHNIAALSDTIRYHKDREGVLHAAILAQQGTIKDLQATTEHCLDSTSKRLQIAKREIEGYQQAITAVKGNVLTKTVMVHDTVKFAYKDSSITETGSIVHDTLHENYTVTVPVTLTEYSHRKNLFAPELHYVDGYSQNPNARITGLKSVLVVKGKPRVWRIAEAVGIGFACGLVVHGFILTQK